MRCCYLMLIISYWGIPTIFFIGSLTYPLDRWCGRTFGKGQVLLTAKKSLEIALLFCIHMKVVKLSSRNHLPGQLSRLLFSWMHIHISFTLWPSITCKLVDALILFGFHDMSCRFKKSFVWTLMQGRTTSYQQGLKMKLSAYQPKPIFLLSPLSFEYEWNENRVLVYPAEFLL